VVRRPERIAVLFRALAAEVADGMLAVDIEADYPIHRIKEADLPRRRMLRVLT
jgi:hypothetical protein